MATRIADAARSAAADAVVTRIDGGAGAGTLKIYSGSQPADADDAETGTLLATFTLADPAFAAASAGVATADTTPALATTGAAAGTAGWFRVEDSTGANVFDGSVGTSGADLNLNTTTISVGVNITITSWTYTHPAG